ncbi:phage tail tape measure protein [Jannaschia seohaensis]|uniref:Lambda family phage tail tape measure protein n=1 Tax=Jannaschia seohaensis TaxID=475081 RepID=A0A2Y9AP08_9RHOB|nr:phage tail tape measure protein [Jannaschia seohaensis]PWJ19154.1 lambda family phage tail tape measure protein [Jannaschia seohaensis]SSA45816.1 phage tail tape measure protein, lambda family [Jannaschia seohaensis]
MDREIGKYGDELDALEEKLGGGHLVISRFTRELGALEGQMLFTQREVKGLSRSFGGSLKRAFDGVVFDGTKLSDALSGLARSMVNATYNAAVKPVQTALGGALAQGINRILPFADGASFAQGRVMPFASGGVVSGPVAFPMRGGTGLMGEAGPEAIMPLRRGADGRLGVEMTGGGAVTVNMNITTPDVAGFRRSRSQVAAEMSRALARGARNR